MERLQATYHMADRGPLWPTHGLLLPGVVGPVLDRQAWKLSEGAVIRHQHSVDAQGVGTDQEIHLREHPALALGGSLGRSVKTGEFASQGNTSTRRRN